MKRISLISGVLVVVMLLAVGVASAEKITWWTWESEDRLAEYQPMIDKFMADTGIEVEVVQVGWSEMQERLMVAIAGGVAPDVVQVSSRWADTVATQGAFADLTEKFKNDPECADFFPAVVDLWTDVNGSIYGLAGDLDMPALFYNMELFDEAGLEYPTDIDWNDWLEISKKLTQDFDGDELYDQFGTTFWWYVWVTLIWANDGEIINEDRTDIALNTPEARQAIEFYKQMYPYMPTMADSQRLGNPHTAALWKSGRVGMAPAGAWMPRYWIWDSETEEYSFDFDVTHMPKSYSGGRATPIEGSAFAVVKGTDKLDAAWKFVKFLTSEEFQMKYGLNGFPSRQKVAKAAFDQPDAVPESKMVLLEVVDYARPFPKGVDWWGSVYSKIVSGLGAYVTDEEGLDAALENISRQVKPILEELKSGQ